VGQSGDIGSAACDPGIRQPTAETTRATVDIFYRCARSYFPNHYFSFEINDLSWWHEIC